MSGKGSGRRPAQISEEEMQARWEKVFGKKDDALKSSAISKDSHYEEAACVSDEMKLHQEKMQNAD